MTHALVVTSIAAPNDVMKVLAEQAGTHGYRFIVIGDTKSPDDFQLEGCDFWSVERQRSTDLKLAAICPTRHYTRKNLGYLLAIRDGAETIVETDDDNYPRDGFWAERTCRHDAATLHEVGWVNVYRYFTDETIWPRGLPMDAIHTELPSLNSLGATTASCPIQQGLADENPDVDAVYRLVLPLPLSFRTEPTVALGRGAWCPFNSQNTTWFPEAFPLMYLPAHCSFRMTDIWRSFVAQRIAWEHGWHVLFHGPTVWQERNEHSLMKDFADEVPGYLNNRAIGEALAALTLKGTREGMGEDLTSCYRCLVDNGWVGAEEMPLLAAWIEDLADLGAL